ncbi:MAG: hypothetical protein JST89_04155 [Cyanobacteria bacterium SZAS-4]|nr:hypothetical protein [Cyanobacteria bacterium SZAS-4]
MVSLHRIQWRRPANRHNSEVLQMMRCWKEVAGAISIFLIISVAQTVTAADRDAARNPIIEQALSGRHPALEYRASGQVAPGVDVSGKWTIHFTPKYQFRGMDRADHEVEFRLVLHQFANGMVRGKGTWTYGLGPADGEEAAICNVSGQANSDRTVTLELHRGMGRGVPSEKVFELHGVLDGDKISGSIQPGNMTADKSNVRPPQSGNFSMNRR